MWVKRAMWDCSNMKGSFEGNLQEQWGIGLLNHFSCCALSKIRCALKGLKALKPVICWQLHLPLPGPTPTSALLTSPSSLLHTQGGTALIEASKNGNFDVVNLLLAVPGIDLEAKNYVSSYLRTVDCHQWLLETGNDFACHTVMLGIWACHTVMLGIWAVSVA